ncbi:hypothetical protein [Plantactinospora endophytica]|uniref:Uncharacterized protein n=1 Tax=Plantactinospora endophytica TaxID=673535 RepID=A0ABQ4EC46_9ACTN|nr:hypothetical protein [Plantactinospora endophytica]GIG92310.1 hypothetical protein Pen02_72460 [Plantactinospora endophytica]
MFERLGLSTDSGSSRIPEEYDRTADDTTAVGLLRRGYARTGPGEATA